MFKQHYHLEFVLETMGARPDSIKNSLRGLIESVDILPLLEDGRGDGKNFKIRVKTADPELVFDICSQFGRLKSVKVSEATT